MTGVQEPQYAYQDPAALAWTAQLLRTARRRRIARLAAEEAAEQAEQQQSAPHTPPQQGERG
jgi:hypothetical protein